MAGPADAEAPRSTRSHTDVGTNAAIGVHDIGGFARRSHPAAGSAAESTATRMAALIRINGPRAACAGGHGGGHHQRQGGVDGEQIARALLAAQPHQNAKTSIQAKIGR